MPALSNEVATKYMKAAQLEPLVPYPGNGKLPWKSRCLQCGLIVKPSLSSVRNNGGGCRPCGLKKSAKSRSTDSALAISVMRKAGAEPISNYPGSGKPWLCKCKKCGKEILPRYGNVKKGTAACVYCSGKKIDSNDASKLMVKYGYTPLVEYPGSNMPWKAIHNICGELVSPRFTALQSGRGGCQKCGLKATKEKQMGDPIKAREFFLSRKLEPLAPYPGSNRPWKSRCLICTQIVSPQYSSIKNGRGCGACAGKVVEAADTEDVMLAAGLKPLTKYPGAKSAWKCKCMKCGKTVATYYSDVKHQGAGCKYCAGKAVDPKDAEKLMRKRGLIPQVPYERHNKKWHCKCKKCGRDVYPVYNSIQQGRGGCKYCAKVWVDEIDAIGLMREHNLEPLIPYPGSKFAWKCRCLVCGKITSPQHAAIKNGQGSCVYCSRKVVDPEDALKVMLKNNLQPLEPYSRSDGPWKCRCLKCGRTVTPAYVAVNGGQGGCKYCAPRGIDYAAPAFIYLITNPELVAHKIGIGNDKTKNNRLKEHQRQGWLVYESMKVSTGEDAEILEKKVLVWLRREMMLPYFLLPEQMPQGGYSETVNAEEITLPTIWAKVEELRKFNG